MELQQIQVKRTALDKVPAEERTLLVLLAHAANELNILAKFFHWAADPVDGSPIETKGNNAVTMLVIRLLSGKLYEAWKLLEKALFGAKLSKTYEPAMGTEERAALQNLKRYFRKANAIEGVRKGHSFHYAPDQITDSYSSVPATEELDFYLGKEGLNTLYYFANVIANRAMLNEIDKDHAVALERLRVETTQTHRDFLMVFNNLMAIAVKQHLGTTLEALGASKVEIAPALTSSEITIPFFVRLSDEDAQQAVPRDVGRHNGT